MAIALIGMLQLVNDRAFMGKCANPRIQNMLAWAIALASIVVALILALLHPSESSCGRSGHNRKSKGEAWIQQRDCFKN